MIIYKQTPVTLSKTENFQFNKRMERLKQPTVSIPEKKGTERPAPVREQSKGISVKLTGEELFCKHLFDLSFAEASERNRKLRNSDEFPWKAAQIVRCRSSAYPFTSGETAGCHMSGDHWSVEFACQHWYSLAFSSESRIPPQEEVSSCQWTGASPMWPRRGKTWTALYVDSV